MVRLRARSRRNNAAPGFCFRIMLCFRISRPRRTWAFGARDGKRAEHCIHAFDLSKLRAHFPRQLSGGQQQRVALARALAADPALLSAGRAALRARCRFPRPHAAGSAPHAARKRRAEHRGDARSRRGHRVRRLDRSDDRWHDPPDRTSARRFPASRRSASGRIVGRGEHSTGGDCRASRGSADRRRGTGAFRNAWMAARAARCWRASARRMSP